MIIRSIGILFHPYYLLLITFYLYIKKNVYCTSHTLIQSMILLRIFVVALNLLLIGVQHANSSRIPRVISQLNPGQIRLALVPNGMIVSWQTLGVPPNGSNPNTQPSVIYGLSATSLFSKSIDGNWTVYDTRIPLYTSYFYNVKLPNLSPSTTYFYQIEESTEAAASTIYSFESAPAVGDSNTSLNITIVGDLGHDALLSMGDCKRTMDGLQQFLHTTDFYLHAGDLAYADDAPYDYEMTYNEWQSSMTSVTSVRPYMTIAGNHEVTCFNAFSQFCPQQERNFSTYLHRFRMPGPESGGFLNMWWSQDYGMVHVIGIDTETDFPNSPSGSANSSLPNGNFFSDSAQLAWLTTDLQRANANRNQVPWILVTGHRPWFVFFFLLVFFIS
jgi:hypothetical protein